MSPAEVTRLEALLQAFRSRIASSMDHRRRITRSETESFYIIYEYLEVVQKAEFLSISIETYNF